MINDKIKKEIEYALEEEAIGFFAIVIIKDKRGLPIPTIIQVCEKKVTSEKGREISDELFKLADIMKPIFIDKVIDEK